MKRQSYHFEEAEEGLYRISDVRNEDIEFYGLLGYLNEENGFTNKGCFQERLERHPDWEKVETRDASSTYVNSKYHAVGISTDITLDLQGDSFNSVLELREAEAFLRGDDRAKTIRSLLTP